MKVELAAISTKSSIDVEAFRKYCYDTAKQYVELYKWNYMPTSVHVILIHGLEIIEEFFVPIGMLSEEAQKTNNKNVKRFRDKFARKFSR